MKLIIAGSRNVQDKKTVIKYLFRAVDINDVSLVISGGCYGVDQIGEQIADDLGIPKKVIEVKKDEWSTFGKAAGPMRNRKMAEQADALLAIWDGKSRGTKNMIEEALKKNLKVFVFTL